MLIQPTQKKTFILFEPLLCFGVASSLARSYRGFCSLFSFFSGLCFGLYASGVRISIGSTKSDSCR